jgi:hypothetical protein
VRSGRAEKEESKALINWDMSQNTLLTSLYDGVGVNPLNSE